MRKISKRENLYLPPRKLSQAENGLYGVVLNKLNITSVIHVFMIKLPKGVIVAIFDDLLNIPQRENAGSIVPNRYQYQYHWSLIKMLELYDTQEDFAMFFEFGDDILILDSSKEPSTIDFYQIKTQKQKNVLCWTLTSLTNKGTKLKPKISIIEKLIDNYVRYKYENIKGIKLVSNLPFKFEKDSILSEQEFTLENLTENEQKKILEQTCAVCNKKNCKQECKSIICFSCTGLSIDHFRDTCVGKLNKFLLQKFPQYAISPNALYDVLLKDIEIKSIKIANATLKDELIRQKCISKEQFNKQLSEFQKNTMLHNQWIEIDGKFSKIFPINQRKLIKKAFNRFVIDSLNPDNLILEQIIKTIQTLLEQKTMDENISDEQLKLVFNEICELTISTNEVDTNIFDRHYMLAIILREYCYVDE